MSLSLILFAILAFAFVLVALGSKILRTIGVEISPVEEHLTVCAGVGVIFLELLVFFAETTSKFQWTLLVVSSVTLLASVREFPSVANGCRTIVSKLKRATRFEHVLVTVIASVLIYEFLVAMAPLTGSDALHYHFAAPLYVLRQGFSPNFFLTHSFLIGQGHLLILLGLAAKSERLATGSVFLGGVLSAFALGCLSRRWMSAAWSLCTVLVFLSTPLVFWQIAGSGCPDVWMCLFVISTILAITSSAVPDNWRKAMLAGCLAGGIAGAKYTGCIFAVSLLMAFVLETRSLSQAVWFGLSSIVAGGWPYLRNFLWTGDPVFPFLTSRLFPEKVNWIILNDVLRDTHVPSTGTVIHRIWYFLSFLCFAGIDPATVGFWSYFGPLVIALCPLILLPPQNGQLRRTTLICWSLSALMVALTTGMTRFLLPIFPVALSVVFAGAATLDAWAPLSLKKLVKTSVLASTVIGLGALMIYGVRPIRASLGIQPALEYLRERSPDYQYCEFVNHSLGASANQDNKVLLFWRHLYAINVPFLYGYSWGLNPSALRSRAEWAQFFKENKITWVVRSPGIPPLIASSLEQLERDGLLVPAAETDVEDFTNMRATGERKKTHVVILRVRLA